MKLHVLKHPNPNTLAECRQVADDDPAPVSPWELMGFDEFSAWRDAQPPIPPPPAPIPETVTPWQMRRALNQLKLRDAVEAAVAAADQDTKDGWDYAIEIRRDNPLIAGMAAALGMDDAKLDDLFRLADSFK